MRYHQGILNLALDLKAFPVLCHQLSLCHRFVDGDTDTDALADTIGTFSYFKFIHHCAPKFTIFHCDIGNRGKPFA